MLAKLLEDLARRKARKFGVATDVDDLLPLQNSPRFSQPVDLPDLRQGVRHRQNNISHKVK